MENKVFAVSGDKKSSFIMDESSLKFSSKDPVSWTEFQESWDKMLTLATRLEIKYDAITAIKKEDNDDTIVIKYKGLGGLPSECEFSFAVETDATLFFHFFEKSLYFQKNYETLTPFKAIRNYLFGLLITIAISIYGYFEAIALENGTADIGSSRKVRAFQNIVGLLGDKGVIIVGIAISAFIGYKIWTRFKNPPNQLSLLPPNN